MAILGSKIKKKIISKDISIIKLFISFIKLKNDDLTTFKAVKKTKK